MIKFIFTLLFIPFFSQCQVKEIVDSVITNQKTDKHINIPGTRLYIIPPPGFTLSKEFLGLEKGNNVIIIYDIIGSSLQSNVPNFDRSKFEKKGLKVYDARDIKVTGFDAKYLFLQSDIAQSAHSLVFGDSSFSTMIMATYLNIDEQTGKDIVKAINSIYYEKNKKPNPFDAAQFSLDDTATKLKFCKYVGNLYVYTLEGKESARGIENPVAFVTQLPLTRGSSPKAIAESMLSQMESSGIKLGQVKDSIIGKINGYDSYEAEVYGELDGKRNLLYQFVVSNGTTVIAIQAVADTDFENILREFKTLAHSVIIK